MLEEGLPALEELARWCPFAQVRVEGKAASGSLLSNEPGPLNGRTRALLGTFRPLPK